MALVAVEGGEQQQQRKRKVATSVWLSGTGRYPTLCIPPAIAKTYGIDIPCQIELIMQDNGILIKKYED